MVLDILVVSKVDKSQEPEEIYLKQVWEEIEEIARALSASFAHEIPDAWRITNVVPFPCEEKGKTYRLRSNINSKEVNWKITDGIIDKLEKLEISVLASRTLPRADPV